MPSEESLSAEKIARLKSRYEANAEKLVDIAADEGMTTQAIAALRREHGWRLRTARSKTATKPARRKKAVRRPAKKSTKKTGANRKASPAHPSPPPPGVVDMPTLIARIRAQLEGALETARARGPENDPDGTARLMASLTRTLQSLRALEKDTTQDERVGEGKDALPLDLAELRRELARRIDLLREDREGA